MTPVQRNLNDAYQHAADLVRALGKQEMSTADMAVALGSATTAYQAILRAFSAPVQRSTTVPDDAELRTFWRNAGGAFHGPHVEHGTMEEAKLLPLLRDLLTASHVAALRDLVEVVDSAIECGLFLSVDGKRPDVQALERAHAVLALYGRDPR